jgi:thioredoxin reductase
MRQLDGVGRAEALDLVIVGAGPAGFSATLAAMQHGLRSVTVEQETLGGAVAHYPRGKLVMTAPAHLPLVGKVRLGETSKEELLDFWQGVERQTGARINYSERVEAVTTEKPGFVVRTTKASYRARAVLLAVGRRGTPRRLGVPGEEQSKVVYRLIDPEQYRGRRVLVAGGGDSAIEAAIALAAEPETVVTLSYRGEAFGRIKEKNRTALGVAAENRRLDVFLRSNLSRIGAQEVELDRDGEPLTLPNDAVVVCAGGILPTAFLRDIGVIVETKHGTA